MVGGQDFTAKDFRTWAGTLFAARTLQACGACRSRRQIKQQLVQAITQVAERLGNTVAVCRKCYIHPAVMQGYIHGSLLTIHTPRDKQRVKKTDSTWQEEETALVAFLQEWKQDHQNGCKCSRVSALCRPAYSDSSSSRP
jgi:DNA topoisomerase-1